MKRLFYLILIATMLGTGCSKFREVDIKELSVSKFELINTTTANIEVEYIIENPSSKSFTLRSADGVLKKGGVNFANATLISADIVDPRVVSINRIKFRVELNDPLSLLSMGMNVSRWNLNDFRLDAVFVIKPSGSRSRTLKYKDIPLDRIANRL